MKKLVSLFVITIISLSVIVSCKKPVDNTPTTVKRSVLIYMAANNSLNRYAKNNLLSLRENYSESDYKNCNIIVYYHGVDNNINPKLMKVSNTDDFETIKEYENHNSADSKIMVSIINDFKTLFPAESYGCIFWSHGTGWLPKSFTGRATKTSPFLYKQEQPEDEELINHPFYQYIRKIDYPDTKAFGQNGSDWMEIEDMEDGLRDNEFDFIIFDACYMGSIEVAYALRKKTKWMLASPTEILGDGLQYATLAKNIFSDDDYPTILKNIAVDFTNKYRGETTYAIYDLSKIDNFIANYKALMATIPDKIGTATSSNIQRFDRFSDHVIFDMVHYISTISKGTHTSRIQNMVDDLVVHKYAAARMLLIPITNYSGISTYIPFESYNAVTPSYKKLRWWNNVLKQ